MIELYCQHCGHHLKIPEQYAGQTGTCNNCKKTILVPGVEIETAAFSVPTQKTNGIPYKWIGATAAVMAVIGIGIYMFLPSDDSTNPPVVDVGSSAVSLQTAKLDEPSPGLKSSQPFLSSSYVERLDDEKQKLAASDNPLYQSISEILPDKDANKYLEIPWRTDLLAARRESNETGKPIFLWVMDGHPLGST